MLKNWNFQCHCKICSLEEDDLKKNEELRSKIIERHENVPMFGMIGEVSCALSAAKEKLELMSKIEDEVILEMPAALLELYELSIVSGASEEETDEYKNRAFILASKLGNYAMDMYEKKIKKLAFW